MSFTGQLRTLKRYVKAFEGDEQAKAVLDTMRDLLDKLSSGKKADIEKQLTKWQDVNETMELAGEVTKLIEKRQAVRATMNLIQQLISIVPVFAEIKKAASGKKKSSKKK